MDSSLQLLFTASSCLAGFFLLFYYYHHHRNLNSASRNKNPLPRAGGVLPIIGHLHHFGGEKLAHRTLAAMAEKHGPAFTIKLGSRENLVVSTMEMAKECFTTLDKVFADRPMIAATRIMTYGGAMFGFAPFGPHWRHMRKIATLQLLAHRRIDQLANVRASEIRTSLKELHDSTTAAGGKALTVDMKPWFGDLTLNAFVRMVVGKRLVGTANGGGEQKLVRDYFYYFGVFVLSDAIPSMGWLDFQGHEKSMKLIAEKLDLLMEEWLKEHRERRKKKSGEESRVIDQDFMDVMLTILEGESDDFPQFEFDADTIIKSTCLVKKDSIF